MKSIKTGWHHIRRSPIQSFTALLLMTFSFILISLFIIVSNGTIRTLNYFETKPEITIYLKDGLDNVAIEKLKTDLSNYDHVKEVKFISKDKALEIYKQQNQDNADLTEMVTADILPASIEVTVSDPTALEKIYQNYATKSDVVDEIIYQKDIINTLLDWTNTIRKGGIVVISIVLLVTFFAVSSIIGMKTTNRKDEIKISRLLGASNWYVKKPFLFEGIFYGFFGSFLGSILVFVIFFIKRQLINSFFSPIEFISSDLKLYGVFIVSELVLGCIIGLLASLIGVKRYIKF
jgi:cell division transport system permease protein